MPTAEVHIRDGEARLIEKLFEHEMIDEVMKEANKRKLLTINLVFERVTKNGEWKSTQESTIPSPILYLVERGLSKNYLIVKRQKIDTTFGLWRYEWIA